MVFLLLSMAFLDGLFQCKCIMFYLFVILFILPGHFFSMLYVLATVVGSNKCYILIMMYMARGSELFNVEDSYTFLS